MAGKTSAWTTLGTNTNAVDDATNTAYKNPSEDLLSTIPRHECHMWLDDTSAVDTSQFNWAVNGDLTITFNATKVNLDNTIGNCTAQVMGSVTGDSTHAIELAALGTTTFDDAVVTYVYDYDAKGRLPYMFLRVTPASDVDNTDNPIKIVVTAH
jgi:hypothetical protein